VNAILNEIAGKNHLGTANTTVPTILGMNFQAVSIGEKLIYQHGAVRPPFSVAGGYVDSIGTPSASLLQEIQFVDSEIGRMVAQLRARNLLGSTLIIITAKHGQSPVDTSRYNPNGSPNDPATILGTFLAPSENSAIGPTEDDVALLWLADSSNTPTAVAALEAASPTLPLSSNISGIGQIYSGPTMGLYYNAGDSRAPDILVIPNVGVTYSNSKKKQAEHGGFAHDDTSVIMLVSNPSFKPSTVTQPVETRQVAPTILTALGLNPAKLNAVQTEGTQALPGTPL
jgi:arylsulfatase A-like enzyme